MAKKVIKSVTTDPRYLDVIEQYSHDWAGACLDFFGKDPSWQQDEVIDSVNVQSSRTSITSGHGTGKSDLASMIIIIFMILHKDARVVIVANKIKQVRDIIWKYMKINFEEMRQRVPWLAKYFVLTETEFYEITSKGVWFVSAKGFRINQESSLAGEHARFMLTIVDEACGVNNKAFGVLLGAATGYDNRFMCMSQPLIQGGFFYDTHHSLSAENGGAWTSIILDSMMSPWVERAWILEHLIMYGGIDSPEFIIKVLGRFPKHMSDMLLSRSECEAATKAKVELDDDWGWVATCDVGNGRDRSVINIGKVSGEIGAKRKVKSHRLSEMSSDMKPLAFARRIVATCLNGSYPNITIVVDADGIGAAVVEYLLTLVADMDVEVQPINWGLPCFTKRQKKRFINRRAMAHVYCKEAIIDERHKLDPSTKTIDQGSKLPIALNEAGQWQVMAKKLMKSKLQIPSPDRFDTHCFFHLANYTPHNEEMYSEFEEVEDEMAEFLD